MFNKYFIMLNKIIMKQELIYVKNKHIHLIYSYFLLIYLRIQNISICHKGDNGFMFGK